MRRLRYLARGESGYAWDVRVGDPQGPLLVEKNKGRRRQVVTIRDRNRWSDVAGTCLQLTGRQHMHRIILGIDDPEITRIVEAIAKQEPKCRGADNCSWCGSRIRRQV